MTEQREQLVLDLPHRAALGAEDFLVSGCNQQALRLIDDWPGWASKVQLLIGPAASGKTHLVRVWQARSNAAGLKAEALTPDFAAQVAEGDSLVLEDVDRTGPDETSLFHLMNAAQERGFSLLLTSRSVPARWNIALPDLLSRLNGLPVVEIGAPDEALLKTVMLKQFADRQLDIEPKVLDYLTLHVERSLEAVAEAVAAVDRAALASGRKISRQLAAEALSKKVTAE